MSPEHTNRLRELTKALQRVDVVKFPMPGGHRVNMMPVIPSRPDLNPLPQYQDMIERCSQDGEVWYLTVDESLVLPGESQRRAGVHVEAPGKSSFGGGPHFGGGSDDTVDLSWGGGGNWGGGSPQPDPDTKGFVDGIYMASTVSGSCRAWNVEVTDRDHHGVCERPEGAGHLMGAGELWWMTDKCPHEALPVRAATYRQFFRLVSPKVSVWFARHNTPNPLGVQPSCRVTNQDKFATLAL